MLFCQRWRDFGDFEQRSDVVYICKRSLGLCGEPATGGQEVEQEDEQGTPINHHIALSEMAARSCGSWGSARLGLWFAG